MTGSWATFIRISAPSFERISKNLALADAVVRGDDDVHVTLGIDMRDIASMPAARIVPNDPEWQKRVAARLRAEALDPEELVQIVSSATGELVRVPRWQLLPPPEPSFVRDIGAAGAV